MKLDLPLVSAAVLSLIIIVYVILDGFDLGIGILFPFARNRHERDVMMTAISPVWDGNETWLVLGAATLYGGFPLAYSILLPLLYVPITLMLAALIFRGIAFEFRFKADKARFIWDASFSFGSALAAFMQGLILGTFVQGYGSITDLKDFYWLTPFSIMTGIAVVNGYALLGATWLLRKASGDLQATLFKRAKYLLVGVTFFMLLVSVWTPWIEPEVRERWFSLPNMFYLAPFPIATGVVLTWNYLALSKRDEYLPFYLSIAAFVFAYSGFGISLWPYIVPRRYTFWQASSHPSSQGFILIGLAILLPVLLAYTYYSYRVFRGKVTSVEHY